MKAFAVLAAIAAVVVITSASAGADPPAVTASAPVIPAKIDCQMLVQNTGGDRNANVPDFQDIPGAPTRINSATIVPATATQPEYCDVRGYVQSQVKFQLKLPTSTWQGRYLQFGCGGFCGSISNTTFPACRTELGGDFAIAATNDGHDAAGTDALWAGQTEQPRIDFGYRAVHVVAVASKAIQAAYYGRGPIKSYFQGCSDGGREGLMEAQRYPDDFDGIIAGAPANHMPHSPLFIASAIQANTGPDGTPILKADKLPALAAAVVAACDANDGVTGNGLIGEPRDCTFDPGSIRCRGADVPTCLTPAQVNVVRTIYNGTVDRWGRRLDPRLTPRGSELTWAGWWVPLAPGSLPGAPWTSAAIAFGESAARWLSYPLGQGKSLSDVELSVRDFAAMAQQSKYYDALNPDLEAFQRRGGKLLIYQGQADALVPPSSTLEYWSEMRDEMGGQRRVDRFARLFLVNGMNHCGGGPTPSTSDMILQMVRWVEQGSAPETITAGPLTVPKYAQTRRDDDVEWVGDFLFRKQPPFGWDH
jgi:hypothetical protein